MPDRKEAIVFTREYNPTEGIKTMAHIIAYLDQAFPSETRIIVLNKLLACAAIVVFSIIFQKIGKRAIKRGFERAKLKTKAGEAAVKKLDTTRTIILGLFKYTLLVITVFLILQTFNVNLTSVLTIAGVGGLAVGIGAQSLIKDFINGMFIWFENQYSVGDTITIASQTGKVVDFNLRTTKLVGEDGELYIIPNSEIRIVKNSPRS